MISIKDLRDFFEQIGYHWLGTVDNVYEFPYKPFKPKTFDELTYFAYKHEPILSFIFSRGDKTQEHYFKITNEVFEEYIYDEKGADYDLIKGENYTALWLEFQEELNKKYKM